LKLGEAVAAKSVVLSVRAGGLRVAFWLYNIERDVTVLLDVLRAVVPSRSSSSKL
jgi:hypothetical protein